jgi:putative transposase
MNGDNTTNGSVMLFLMRRRSLNHSVYQHQYHLVWGTKYRRKYIKDYVKADLLKIIFSLVKKYPTLYIERINTDEDHIHIMMEIPPDVAVATVVKKIKWITSIRLKKKYKFIRRIYISGSIWSVGYFSSTIGLNEEQIRKYIIHQGTRDLSTQARFFFS